MNRMGNRMITIPQGRAFVKRACLSLGLSVLIFLVLNYNLTYPAEDEITSTYESILFRFGTYGFTGNLYTFGIAVFLFLWFGVYGERELFYTKSLTVLSVIFGLLNTAALHLFFRNKLPGHSLTANILFLIQSAVWAFLFLLLARIFLSTIEWTSGHFSKVKDVPRHNARLGLLFFAIILLGWLPWIISYYPASMEWDVYDPIMRYLGMKTPSDHHPWFYCCVVGFFYQLGLKIGDKNIGVFLYIVLRAVIMAGINSRCALMLRKNGAPKALIWLTVLFFAFTPVWGAYAKHAFKDSIGAAFFCWYIFSLVEVVLALHENRLKLSTCLEYSMSGLFGSLFRNNTWYVVLPVTVLLLVIVLLKKRTAALRQF